MSNKLSTAFSLVWAHCTRYTVLIDASDHEQSMQVRSCYLYLKLSKWTKTAPMNIKKIKEDMNEC